MQLPYLFVAVSLDGRIMGVRFNEGEDGEGLEAQRQSEFARYHAHAPQRHDYRCYGSGNLRTTFRARTGKISLLLTRKRVNSSWTRH